MRWQHVQAIHPRQYKCGHCDNKVGSDRGWTTSDQAPGALSIHICPLCFKPSIFISSQQLPGTSPGNDVASLPHDIEGLYQEARRAVAANAHTASVLACRKLLMNIAVAQGAAPNLSFLAYVDHLATAGFIPPNGRTWVDHIRKKGNEATHEIHLMTRSDAEELVTFSEMLLKFIYEFPLRVPAP